MDRKVTVKQIDTTNKLYRDSVLFVNVYMEDVDKVVKGNRNNGVFLFGLTRQETVDLHNALGELLIK